MHHRSQTFIVVIFSFISIIIGQHLHRKYHMDSHNNNQILNEPVHFVSVTIFHERKVLVCRRGVGGRDYGKIFSCGGAVDQGESPAEAAIRETHEEAGVILSTDELQYFDTFTDRHNRNRINYYVHMDYAPIVRGPERQCAWEMLKVQEILGVPTQNQWCFVEIDDLIEYYRHNPAEAKSSFGRLFLKMVDAIK